METKKCRCCQEDKSLDEFGKNSLKADGKHYYCKACVQAKMSKRRDYANTYAKKYYKDNQDKIIQNRKEYYENNKEMFKQNGKRNRQKNPEQYKQMDKNHYYSKKDGHHSVYLIPSENYVGITESLYYRMAGHKSVGRDISNYRVLATFEDRELGLELEELLHDLGYEGRGRGIYF